MATRSIDAKNYLITAKLSQVRKTGLNFSTEDRGENSLRDFFANHSFPRLRSKKIKSALENILMELCRLISENEMLNDYELM